MLQYFAYGSNLHFERLRQRVASARVIGKAVLPGYTLVFNKHGADHSGKCNIMPGASQVQGVTYEINPEEKAILDRCEKGYGSQQIRVLTQSGELEVFTYIAHEDTIHPGLLPYHWYKQYVVQGARMHGLDDDYCLILDSQLSIDDEDRERSERHFDLLRHSL